jgi:hypothetical protein
MFQLNAARRASLGLALGILLAAAGPALAGGFYVALERPATAGDPRLKDAVLIVRPNGCIQPGTTGVSVTAEGLVNGRRQSIAVPVVRLSPDVYAIQQQWPAEGAWLLVIRGSAQHTGGPKIHQYRLLKWEPNAWASGNGQDLPARTVARQPVPKEIDTLLRTAGKTQTAARATGSAR